MKLSDIDKLIEDIKHEKFLDSMEESCLIDEIKSQPIVYDSDKIESIADHYGYELQSRQCIEEMAELTQAINKLWRACRDKVGSDTEIASCKGKITEEIADVQIMLWQLMYLLGADIAPTIEGKVERQLMRIKREDEGNGKKQQPD